MAQLSLFPPVDPNSRFGRFLDFHKSNPEVWRLFQRFAGEALESGRNRFGARLIGERIRWETIIQTTDKDYKVNNDFWPYYARLLMLTDASFAGVFERRDRHFDTDDETLVREAM